MFILFTLPPLDHFPSGKISRLIENMIPMPPNTFAAEQAGKPESGRDIILGDLIVASFRLADDKFTDLFPQMEKNLSASSTPR